MSRIPWTPWHKVARLREDLKSGELSLAVFAAGLYDVAMGRARPAKDVVARLAGKNEKVVRQLELTCGGGKTHTLVTLFHLVNEPERLPSLRAPSAPASKPPENA